MAKSKISLDKCRTALENMWDLFKYHLILISNISSVQQLSHVQLFATPWTAACQASLPITNSRSFLKLISIESVMPSNHLILCCPLSSCLHSFPASGSFPMSQFFTSGGQSIGTSASASVLPMNIQLIFFRIDWFDLLAVPGTLKSFLKHHSSKVSKAQPSLWSKVP